MSTQSLPQQGGGSSTTAAAAAAAAAAASGLPQYFSLRWNNHPANLVSVFSGLYSSETLVDVTLAAEGKHIQAHKMLLSACSDYFQSLFSVNPCQHPIVILKDVRFEDLQTVVQFMYNGVVNVSSEKLPAVLKTADTLQIKGLGEKFSESVSQMMGGSYSSSTTPRLLSVPSQHSDTRQLSTESLPEYLHRTRDLSPRQASTDSTRQYSIESSVSAVVRKQPTPPASPPRHYRKKFRRMSGGGSSSERGNSLEDDRSSAQPPPSRSSPPAIHLSPSRQSSSGSTEPEGGMIVAKKKRELFSARSSRSGGSNKSSASDYSREHSFKQLDSSGSSGQSHSISQSQEGEPQTSGSITSTNATTVTAASAVVSGASASLAVPPSGRTLTRAQSAGEACGSSSGNSGGIPTKRNRFLKRQDCLEKGMDLTTDSVDTAGGASVDASQGLTVPTIRSSPNSPMMSPFYPGLSSPPDTKILSPVMPDHHVPPPPPPTATSAPPSAFCPAVSSPSLPTAAHQASTPLTAKKQSSQPTLPSESVSQHVHPYYGHLPPPPPATPAVVAATSAAASSHRLPAVRVIPDAALDHLANADRLPVPNMRLLCPPEFSDARRIQALVKARPAAISEAPTTFNRGPIPVTSTTAGYDPVKLEYPQPPPSQPSTSNEHGSVNETSCVVASASVSSISASLLPLQTTDQFGHCPKAREGPALGCNFCWNTTDSNGRILRRKTKYHCPECQTNLCIVPCFQQYHEALEREKGGSPQ